MKLLADALANCGVLSGGPVPLSENTGSLITTEQQAIGRFSARLHDNEYSSRGIAERTAIGIAACRRLATACESPIEATMCGPLIFADYVGFEAAPALACLSTDGRAPPSDVYVIPQFAFVRCRADFAVVGVCGPNRKFVLLECDGKEFHQDRQKDDARDAFFESHGIDVVRATGAEIYDEPFAVAARVALFLTAWRQMQDA